MTTTIPTLPSQNRDSRVLSPTTAGGRSTVLRCALSSRIEWDAHSTRVLVLRGHSQDGASKVVGMARPRWWRRKSDSVVHADERVEGDTASKLDERFRQSQAALFGVSALGNLDPTDIRVLLSALIDRRRTISQDIALDWETMGSDISGSADEWTSTHSDALAMLLAPTAHVRSSVNAQLRQARRILAEAKDLSLDPLRNPLEPIDPELPSIYSETLRALDGQE